MFPRIWAAQELSEPLLCLAQIFAPSFMSHLAINGTGTTSMVGRGVLTAPPEHPSTQPARWGQTRPTTSTPSPRLALRPPARPLECGDSSPLSAGNSSPPKFHAHPAPPQPPRTHRSRSCGAAPESSPRREPWVNRPRSTKPRQGRQISALATRPILPPLPGLASILPAPHGSRRGLLSPATPWLPTSAFEFVPSKFTATNPQRFREAKDFFSPIFVRPKSLGPLPA
jgi:hypothetical protein